MNKMKDESSNAKKGNDNNVPKAIAITNKPCILLKTLISLAKDIETENEKIFFDNMGRIVLCGAKNPCIMNQEELFDMKTYRPKEKEHIYKLNDELNNAESLEEIEKCLEKAKKDNIAVREEYVSIFNFVNDLKKMKDLFESIGENTQKLFAYAIQAMLSAFNLAIVECSLEYQEEKSKNFRDHNTEKENRLLVQIAVFQDYLLKIEEYWSSKKEKRPFNIGLASKYVFNDCMKNNDETLKMLFNNSYGIDCTNPKNVQKCINKLTMLTKEFRNRFLSKQSDYKNKPQKRKPRSAESRKNSREGQKKAIERKKTKA